MVKERGVHPSRGMRVKRRTMASERSSKTTSQWLRSVADILSRICVSNDGPLQRSGGCRQQNDESMVKERGVYASRVYVSNDGSLAKERGQPW